MQTINSIQDQIIEDFALFEDWMQKYEYLIQFGKNLQLIDPAYRTDDYRINGCQSNVWVKSEFRDGHIFLSADSDAIITKGIISLLLQVLSGQKPDDIVNADLYFIEKTGLRENLSPTRSNGLLSMIKQIKIYALGYVVKN